MKKIASVLFAIIVLAGCGDPIDSIKNVDYTISYFNGWKAINYEQPKDGIDVIIYPADPEVRKDNPNVSVRISHEYQEKLKWGYVREATVDYPKNAVEKYKEYNYKLVHNEYVKMKNARNEEVLVIEFEGQADGIDYTILQYIYALDYKAIYVTGFYPKDDKYYELKVKEIMDTMTLEPPK